MRPRWSFALNKRKIAEHRKRLRQVQQMFVFIRDAMTQATPTDTPTTANASVGARGHQPVTLEGTGKDASGQPVSYSATLTIRPARPGRTPQSATKGHVGGERSHGEQAKKALLASRRSPYFSSDLISMPRPTQQQELNSIEERKAKESTEKGEGDEEHLELLSEQAAERHTELLVEEVMRLWTNSNTHLDSSATADIMVVVVRKADTTRSQGHSVRESACTNYQRR